MSKKAKNMTDEIVKTDEVVEPIITKELLVSNDLKQGFIAITHKDKGGRIIVAESQYKTLYKEDVWEVLETYKKK